MLSLLNRPDSEIVTGCVRPTHMTHSTSVFFFGKFTVKNKEQRKIRKTKQKDFLKRKFTVRI